MYIVDFQLARYASPGLDLALLLYLCLERAQRSQHLSDLLRYYSDNLHSTLTLMNGDTLDKETLFDM